MKKSIKIIIYYKTTASIGGAEKYLRDLYNYFPEYNFVEIYRKIEKNSNFSEIKNVDYIQKRPGRFLKRYGDYKTEECGFIFFQVEFYSIYFFSQKYIENTNFYFVDHSGHFKNWVFRSSKGFLNKIIYTPLIYLIKIAIYKKIKNINLITFTQEDIKHWKNFFPNFKSFTAIPLFFNPLKNPIFTSFQFKKYDLLFIGRLVKQKKLFKIVKLENKLKLSVAYAGTGSLEKHFYDKKNYFGYANESLKNKLFLESKYYILTSKYEGFPFTLLEAMQRGIPILILNNFPAAKYLIGENNERGFLANSLKDLQKWISKNINDEFIWNEKSKNCIDFSKNNLNIENSFEKYRSIFNNQI